MMAILTPNNDGTSFAKEEEASVEFWTTSKGGFVRTLLQRMNPSACLGEPCGEAPIELVIPEVVEGIAQEKSKRRRSKALTRLGDLTDKEHKENRTILLSDTRWNVLPTLVEALHSDEDRRTVCLILNNLSVPFENKKVMISWDGSRLINALLEVVYRGDPEAHFCVACLMNLSVSEESKVVLMAHCPKSKTDPLLNDRSLLRIVESCLQIYAPYVFHSQLSVEREVVRYSLGLLWNLTTIPSNASLLCQTDIPKYVLHHFLRDTPNPISKWKKDSVEDYSMLLLCNLAKQAHCCRVLRRYDAKEILGKVDEQSGIHAFRASTILCSMEENTTLVLSRSYAIGRK